MPDFRRFYTDFKKLSVEFLVFKESFPIRMEAMSFINLIIKKSRTPGNQVNTHIYDELIKNIKKYNLIRHELIVIKNNIKGVKVHSVFMFMSIILITKNKDLISIIDRENSADYLNYSIQKDGQLKKMFQEVVNYLKIKEK